MRIFFAWAQVHDQFDPLTHCREDLEIFDLSITQREGEVALAKLIVASQELTILLRDYAFISFSEEGEHPKVLFKGRVLGCPRKLNEFTAEIELSAEPFDADEQLESLANSLKHRPFYDELFIAEGDNDPVNVLETRSDLFHWDRCHGNLGLSNLFQGRRIIDVSKYILADSLKIMLGDTPLSSMRVNLTAEWTQRAVGEINIFPKIARSFSKGIINTLSPQQLMAHWPKVGDKIGPALSRKQTGYQVVSSCLKEITPLSTGILNFYPTLTPEINSFKDGAAQPIRLKRTWFKGELVLNWYYRQKRKEIATFTLKHTNQLTGKIRTQSKVLNLSLQGLDKEGKGYLPNPSCASFFQTKRGRQAIEHAIEMARAHLAGSARCLEVEFLVPFNVLSDISLDDSVRIKAEILPGKELIGKVIEYRLVIEAGKSFAWVRLAVTPGQESQQPDFANVSTEHWVEEGYIEEGHKDYYQTPSGITYKNYCAQMPTEGLVNAGNLTIHDMVKAVHISGDAEEQTAYLLKNEYPYREDLQTVLAEKPTVITLTLKDLSTKEVAENFIEVELPYAWSSPKQISLL